MEVMSSQGPDLLILEYVILFQFPSTTRVD